MSTVHNNFKEAQWYYPHLTVTVGGAGGIGSWALINLARQGYSIELYEHDSYLLHNVGNQLVKKSDIGKAKSLIAKNFAAEFSDNFKFTCLGKYENGYVNNICISCFDNMEARKSMFNTWKDLQLVKTPEYRKEHPDEINIYLDGRMLLENFQVFVVDNPKRITEYEKWLFTDSEVPDQPCNARATTHTGMMIAAVITGLLLNKVANKKLGFAMRDIPFMTSYNFINMEYAKTY